MEIKRYIFLLSCFLFFSTMYAQESTTDDKKKYIKASFFGQKVKCRLVEAEEMVVEDAATAIQPINPFFMETNKEPKKLPVNLMLPRYLTKENYLVFVIEAAEDQELSIDIYDEEGYGVIHNSSVAVTSGGNFLAIEVTDVKAGDYYLRIRDEDKREINRTISIAKE